MGHVDDLVRLEAELSVAEHNVDRLWEEYFDSVVEVGIIRAQLDAIRARRVTAPDLSRLSQKDAVLTVLRSHPASKRPTEILAELQGRGFADLTLNKVNVVLGRLRNADLVRRHGRGQYLAK